jgi:hypothetical protein
MLAIASLWPSPSLGLPFKQVYRRWPMAHRLTSAGQSGRNSTRWSLRQERHLGESKKNRLNGFLERERPGSASIPARNIHLSECIYASLSQLREGFRPNSLKIGRVKLSRNQVAGVKYDKKTNLRLNPILDAAR